MRKILSVLWLVLLLAGIHVSTYGQQEFDQDERDLIADHINNLMENLSSSLKFSIELPASQFKVIQGQLPLTNDSITQEFVDSLFYHKIDSAKMVQREKIAAQISEMFYKADDDPLNPVFNFAFDTSIVRDSILMLNHFTEKYVNLYKEIEGDLDFYFKSGDDYVSNPRPIIQTANIEKHDRGYKMLINGRMGWLRGIYDTASIAFREIPPEKRNKLGQFYNTREQGPNIDFSTYVFFRKPEDFSSYKIISVMSPEAMIIFPELQDFLRNGVIENLQLYGTLSLTGERPDSTLIPDFLDLFENKDKKSIQCAVFFPDEICQSSFEKSEDTLNISAVQYCENVLHNYSAIATFQVEPITNALQVKKEDNYYVVKWPANIEFIPYTFDDEVPDLGYETVVNLYFKVELAPRGMFGKQKIAFRNATITDIAAYNKEISIPQPTKMGGLSLSAHYNPMIYRLRIDDNSAFTEFEEQYNLSHSIGLDIGYYLFDNHPGRYYGIETGFSYDMINASMVLDSAYYSVDLTQNTQPFYSDTTNEIMYYEERIWARNFNQQIKFKLLTIPVMFHYVHKMRTGVLFDLGIGAKMSLLSETSVKASQNEGIATRKGWYEIAYCDGSTGSYLVENIPEYGYVDDMQVSLAGSSDIFNSMVVFLNICPSFSIPADEIFKHAHIDIGLNFQYGLSSFFMNGTGDAYIMDSPGLSNSVFSNGVKKNDMAFGLKIGLRYFNTDDKRKDKKSKF